jgi:hypothetical protein
LSFDGISPPLPTVSVCAESTDGASGGLQGLASRTLDETIATAWRRQRRPVVIAAS